MVTAGDRLRTARLRKGFQSAAAFARSIGVSPQTYRAHENGQNDFNADQAAAYATRLGVTETWLMFGKDKELGPRSDLDVLETELRKKVASEPPGPRRDAWLKVIAEIERTRAAGLAHKAMSVEAARAIPADMGFAMVRGAVEAGAYREAIEWPEADWYPVGVAGVREYAHYPQLALEVRGPSMNAIYPDGSIIVCVSFIDLQRQPKPGERVVVERRRGTLVEATVKEFVVEDGAPKLYPRSDHPAHQSPIALQAELNDGEDENQDEEIRITALVIGSFRPEVVR